TLLRYYCEPRCRGCLWVRGRSPEAFLATTQGTCWGLQETGTECDQAKHKPSEYKVPLRNECGKNLSGRRRHLCTDSGPPGGRKCQYPRGASHVRASSGEPPASSSFVGVGSEHPPAPNRRSSERVRGVGRGQEFRGRDEAAFGTLRRSRNRRFSLSPSW